MKGAMEGIKVIEVAQWWFVPAAGAVLADWGADVIKIEHPETGDPQRGLLTSGLLPSTEGVNFMMEQSNRGKRSVGLDLAKEEGRELLYRMVEGADVFLTSFLPSARKKLGIDVEDIRAHNPDIVYVRGSGHGPLGPDADKAGYDATSFWIRTGIADIITREDALNPTPPPGGAFGDSAGAMTIAGGIAAALLKRERTGEPSVIDVSLLNTGMWLLSATIVATKLLGFSWKLAGADRFSPPNPLVHTYKTKDDRWLMFNMLQADRYWKHFCEAIGHPELIDDERFCNDEVRNENKPACVQALDDIIATATLDEWRVRLADFDGAWAPMQNAYEIHSDADALANGYLPELHTAEGAPFTLVTSPVQFDESWPELVPAPDHGEHTDEVLLELGLTWDELIELKAAAAVL
ncbi:MAG: Cinnamoyl-CoA:phenyllactate CoA-transferase [Acidimicrobiales bacterium]|nr:Cinnamoyl-CoA:phenyllactate CoA-transferase [Acidimicrobiales bacterium]